MKKKTLLFILPILLILSSCSKEEVFVTPNRTIFYTIPANAWSSGDQGITFSTNIEIAELTADFNERGGVFVYINQGGNIYEPIPQVYDGIAYSYTTQPGIVELDIQSSDARETISPPATTTIKIVLVESEIID